MPVPEHSENIWDRGRWAGVEEVDIDFMTRYIIEHLVRRTDLTGKRILELGSGTGRLSYLLLQAGAASVTLVDNSRKALSLSTQLFEDVEKDRYEIVDADVFECTFDDNFDIVFSSGLIEHFEGEPRQRIVDVHLQHAREDVLILHPSNRLYNRIFDQTPMAKRRYGFARTFSEAELDTRIRKTRPEAVIHHERFHLCYTVPLLHNLAGLNRAVTDTAIERAWGGLCLTQLGP
ncbi:MAG: class I SAM-dependent methyltransferase [Candidatus Hydrogenedentes bacterium]|nr:class I SAM-dependent methyltransferase [Candidatus Hydrogenedentota bacterium]